jgi:hypothetical protein
LLEGIDSSGFDWGFGHGLQRRLKIVHQMDDQMRAAALFRKAIVIAVELVTVESEFHGNSRAESDPAALEGLPRRVSYLLSGWNLSRFPALVIEPLRQSIGLLRQTPCPELVELHLRAVMAEILHGLSFTEYIRPNGS